MDLEKVETTGMVTSEDSAHLESAYIMQVVSGPESEDILVEIELVSEKLDFQEKDNSKPVFVTEELERNNKLWKKVRTRVGAGRAINGWVTPIDSPINVLNDEIETSHVITKVSAEQNDIVDAQVEDEIKQLKSVCETGLANLLDEQKKVKETISSFPKMMERDASSKQKAEILKVTKSVSELEKTIAKFANDISSKQNEIESTISSSNLNQIQGNLDIIYRGVKKSIESTKIGNDELINQFREIKNNNSVSETGVSKIESILTDYLQEVTLNQEIFLRLEDSVDNLKKKIPFVLGAMLVSILAIGFRVFGVL